MPVSIPVRGGETTRSGAPSLIWLALVWNNDRVGASISFDRVSRLRGRGLGLERVTLFWNVVGVIVLAVLAISASSTALAGLVTVYAVRESVEIVKPNTHA